MLVILLRIEKCRALTCRGEYLNRMWLYTLLACIGCSFEEDDEICGVVVSIRKAADKICLWTRTGQDAEKCKQIGRQLKEAVQFPGKIGYQLHNDALIRNSSFNNKNIYEVS